MSRGLDQELASITAVRSHGPWRISQSKAMHIAFPRAYFDSLGLPRLDPRCPDSERARQWLTRHQGQLTVDLEVVLKGAAVLP